MIKTSIGILSCPEEGKKQLLWANFLFLRPEVLLLFNTGLELLGSEVCECKVFKVKRVRCPRQEKSPAQLGRGTYI